MAQRQFIISSPIFHVDADDGTPLAGGKIYVYAAGTTTAETIYQNSNLRADSKHSQPIVLNSRGEAVIYGKGNYKFVITDSDGVAVKTIDEVWIGAVSSWAAKLLDDVTAASARTTLGLGSASTLTAGTGAGNVLLLSTAGYLPAINGSLVTDIKATNVWNRLPPGHLNGLTISPSGTLVSIAAGACCDSTGTKDIRLTSSITKNIGEWTEGMGGNIGAIAGSTWYHVYMIRKTADNGNVDAIISTSASAPTQPNSAYTLYRRIGSLLTNVAGTEFLAYTQNGDEFLWMIPVLDKNISLTTESSVNYTLNSIPLGILCKAIINIATSHASKRHHIIVYPVGLTGYGQPSIAGIPGTTASASWQTNQYVGIASQFIIKSNVSRQIAARIYQYSEANSISLVIVTLGWIDRRGRDD